MKTLSSATRFRLLLAAATLLAFGGSLWSSFHLDDYAIFSDPVLTSPDGWWQVWSPLQTRPLTYFTFWFNHQLGGRHPAGYHAVNLALHLAAVWLLSGLLPRLLPWKPAMIAAALFALHPIQTEAVAYVFARGTLLAAVFCLLSLRAWLKGSHWPAAAWFLPALLAKEECVAFPLALLLLHFSISRNRRELPPIGAMLLLSLAAGARVLLATGLFAGSGAGFSAGVSPISYLAAQGLVILRYFRLLILPWGFTIDPEIHAHPAWQAWGAWLLIAAVCVVAARRFPRAREGFWFLAGLILLLPSSSIFPAEDLAADRRMYLPLLAFSAAAGLLLQKVNLRLLAAAGVFLVLASAARTHTWQTEERLWREAVLRSPGKVRPKLQLARGVPPGEALVLLERAKLLDPGDPRIASEIGRVYLVMKRPDRALAEFGRALALVPNNAQALNNRGVALLALGQEQAARQDFDRALQFDPCLFDARLNLLQLGHRRSLPSGCRYSPDQRRILEGP